MVQGASRRSSLSAASSTSTSTSPVRAVCLLFACKRVGGVLRVPLEVLRAPPESTQSTLGSAQEIAVRVPRVARVSICVVTWSWAHDMVLVRVRRGYSNRTPTVLQRYSNGTPTVLTCRAGLRHHVVVGARLGPPALPPALRRAHQRAAVLVRLRLR